MINIVLAGNPNSGKTTLFNYLTGKNERIGNWMGVTVDAKQGLLKKKFNPIKEEVMITDLPGTYTMDSYTKDEEKSIEHLLHTSVDGILNLVDIAQLERSLVLTLELKDTKKPMVVCLNKQDLAKKKQICINEQVLKNAIQSRVFFTETNRGKGVIEAINALILEMENHA